MKLNNKGLSIVELIIGAALISVVIIFLYRLLIDINHEVNNTNYAIHNQSIRFEIIENVSKDFTDETIKNLSVSSGNITISYERGVSTVLDVTDKDLVLTNKDNIKTKWTFDRAVSDVTNMYVCYSELSVNNYSLKIEIPIYTNNFDNIHEANNYLDDISLVYVGSISDVTGIDICS